MCFAPYISISTFAVEFVLAFFFLFKNSKDKLNRLIAILSFLLGFYQLNEFFICTFKTAAFAKLALSTTAILPAIAISYALILWRKPLKFIWHILIYLPVLAFIVLLNLVINQPALCAKIFITYPSLGLVGRYFGWYYFIYLLVATILFYVGAEQTKNKYDKKLLYLGMIGMFIFTIPTYIFLFALPQYKIQFPSVLCEFALLLALELVFVIWYKERHKRFF